MKRFTCSLFVCLLAVGAQAGRAMPEVTSGKLERLADFEFRTIAPRPVDVWVPDGYPEAGPYAVLYMHDGDMLFDARSTWNGQSWEVADTAQRLIKAGLVRPFIVVAVHNAGPDRRAEYFPQGPFELLGSVEQAEQYSLTRRDGRRMLSREVYSDAYLSALVKELKPVIDARYRVDASAQATAIAGSSMGGLISWYAQLRYPEVFGASASLSTHWPGGFSLENNPVPEQFFAYLNAHLPEPSAGRWYFDYGDATLDALYPALQEQVDRIFRAKGYDHHQFISRFYPGAAHTETAWAARLAEPLRFMFGGRNAETPITLERVEPPFWWVGMVHPTVELMLHGNRISELHPQLTDPRAEISAIHRTDSPNYLFVELRIAPDAEAGPVSMQLIRGADEVVVEFDYELRGREPGSRERQGFSSEDVIYLVVPDRFANGDPSNDSLPEMREAANRRYPGGRHGGDIAGMRAALPYLADLGFTAIWPTPLTENNQPAYSYHGYSATDLFRVDPRFGSNEEYRELVAAARANGMKFIQDIIVNHIGDRHWWMSDLPSAQWINFPHGDEAGNFVPTNHNRSTIQDPYAAQVDRTQFTDGWFVDSMPDLNQREPRLATYMIQNSIWWVEYAGLSGIREDTYSYADQDFLSEWGRRIMQEYPAFNIVGEEWSTNPLIVSYWQRGKQNHDGYVSHTPSMLDFPLYDALLKALVEPEGWNSGWIRVFEMLGNDHVYADPMRLVIFEGNHDTARVFPLLDQDFDLLRMVLTFLTTMRGIPQILYGTELAMLSPKQRDDGAVRANYPGGWDGDAVNAFTRTGLDATRAATQALVRTLFNWRKSATAVHHGRLVHFAPDRGSYTYFRIGEGQTVMVVMNKSTEPLELDLSRFGEVLRTPATGTEIISGQRIELGDSLTVPARATLLIDLK